MSVVTMSCKLTTCNMNHSNSVHKSQKPLKRLSFICFIDIAYELQVESMGEALVVIGASNGWGPYPLTSQQADFVLNELTTEMGRIGADSTSLRRRSESGTEKGKITPLGQDSCYHYHIIQNNIQIHIFSHILEQHFTLMELFSASSPPEFLT